MKVVQIKVRLQTKTVSAAALHRDLKRKAKANGWSLNREICDRLERSLTAERLEETLRRIIRDELR